MALTKRDWILMGVGFGIGFFIFSTLGRRTMLVGMGAGKAEAERLLSKIEKKAKARAKAKV